MISRRLLSEGEVRLGQVGECGDVASWIALEVRVQNAPHLPRGDRAGHVQDFVALVAERGQSPGGLPDLRRVVVPELVRDDLVHGDVQPRVDRGALYDDLVVASPKGSVQLRMLGLDQDPALVRIVGVQIFELDTPVASACRGADETSPLGAWLQPGTRLSSARPAIRPETTR